MEGWALSALGGVFLRPLRIDDPCIRRIPSERITMLTNKIRMAAAALAATAGLAATAVPASALMARGATTTTAATTNTVAAKASSTGDRGVWQSGNDDAKCLAAANAANSWEGEADLRGVNGDAAGAKQAQANADAIAGQANMQGCDVFQQML
jgi:hypothetical protein